MTRFGLGLVCAALLSTAGCYRISGPERAKLQVIAEPETARVFVDEHFVGSGAILTREPKELTVGHHRVTIQAPGYFPHDVEVDLPAGTTTVRIALRPIPQ